MMRLLMSKWLLFSSISRPIYAYLLTLTRPTYASLPTRPPLVLKLDRNGFHAATARLSDSRSG